MAAPKYLEIAEALKARCQQLDIGARLSPERALAEEFEVSVMTIRQALSVLAEEGWVRRTAGSGTFVSRPTVTMGPTLTSFTQDMLRRGFTPSSRVLRSEIIEPDLEAMTLLDLRLGEKVVLLERLRHADGEPMCHEVGLFPARLAPALFQGDLSGSVHAALQEQGTVPRSTQRSVRAVIAQDRECHLLALPPGSPALEIVDLFSDTMGRPMQYVRTRYRYDRYEVLTNIESIAPPPALMDSATDARVVSG